MFIDNDSFNQNEESDNNTAFLNKNIKNENNYFNYNNKFINSSSGRSFDLLKKNNNDNDNLNFTSNSFFKNNYNRNNDLEDKLVEEKKTFKNQLKNEASEIGHFIKNSISKVPETLNKISPFSNNQNPNLKNNNNNENNNFLNDNYRIISRPSSANLFGINSNSLNSLSQSKDQIDINEYNLSVCVSNFETKYSGTEEIIFFQIDLYSNLSKKEWSLYRKYKEFFEMNLIF